jgi:HPt (histidine-containing phosphotransfer) domain-containing protein
MKDFLTKPVLAESLRAMVARWLSISAASGAKALPAAPMPIELPGAGLVTTAPVSSATAPPCFDPSVLSELPMIEDGSDPGYADELLDLFVEDARTMIDEIERTLASGDLAALKRGVHTLKSTAGAVGAMALAAQASASEAALRADAAPGADLATGLRGRLSAFEKVLASERARGAAAGCHWLNVPG